MDWKFLRSNKVKNLIENYYHGNFKVNLFLFARNYHVPKKVSDKEALYVLKINSDKNEIIVGPKEKLGKKTISLKEINLLTNKEDLDQNLFVKVRSTGSLLEAKVDLIDNNNAKVNLAIPEDGISPGQACVFYRKDQFGHKVLGGGWIKE